MVIQHLGKTPNIDQSAYIATNATICGEVEIGKNTRIMFGAQVIAESSPIKIGDNCIVLENAVVHLKTIFPENGILPIGWIAVGEPMQMFSPNQHEDLWQIQKALNFPSLVYHIDDIEELANVHERLCKVMSARFKSHMDDEII